ncbi:hypothetical protein GGS26DRAFT_545709 [Hypomontagnella submonticulosa]|nr:hypothetical protein GGS26DRAFT_545709 [Hypomontagnella submonticulosa]
MSTLLAQTTCRHLIRLPILECLAAIAFVPHLEALPDPRASLVVVEMQSQATRELGVCFFRTLCSGFYADTESSPI